MAINQTSSFQASDFTDECRGILKKTGLFECCCISLHEGRPSYRIYQTGKGIESGMSEIPVSVMNFIREAEEASGMRLFDCCRRKWAASNEQGKDVPHEKLWKEDLYSVSFRVPPAKEKSTGRDTNADMAGDIAISFHTAVNPIIQKGFLLTADGKVLEKKIYYTLVSGGISKNPEKRMQQYISMHEEVRALYKRIFGAESWNQLEGVVESCLAKDLRPFMIGINVEQNGTREQKLYMVSEKRDRVSIHCALELLDLNRDREKYRLADYFIRCNALNLYLRGIGISLINGNLHWRYYWFRK